MATNLPIFRHVSQGNLKYDESMEKYSRKHCSREFESEKLVHIGFKTLYNNSVDGYEINFDVHERNE